MARPLSLAAFAFGLLTAFPTAGQQRSTVSSPELTEASLRSFLSHQTGAITSCADGEQSSARLLVARVRVAPLTAVSTLADARIDLDIRTRPSDRALERCARRRITEDLRRHEHFVGGPVRARHVFRIRPPTPRRPATPSPRFSEQRTQRQLALRARELRDCIGLAGVPEQVPLHVAVDPDGRLRLLHANVPPEARADARSCLARVIRSIRVRGAPASRARFIHSVSLRH